MEKTAMIFLLLLWSLTGSANEIRKPGGTVAGYLDIQEMKEADASSSFDFIYPVLNASFKDSAAREKVNATIMKQLLAWKKEDMKGGFKEFGALNVALAGTEAISLAFYVEVEGYVMIDSRDLLLDLKSGEAFSVDLLVPKDKKAGFYNAVRAQARAKVPRPKDPDCALIYDQYFGKTQRHPEGMSMSASLSAAGVVFSPNLPQATAACGRGVTMPYLKLKPYVIPGSALDRLADDALPAAKPSP